MNDLAQVFVQTLTEKGLSIMTAESMTAGLLASTIASISGSSSILKGGIVSYNEDVKIKILRVDPEILEEHSAESMETTKAMILGLRNLYASADIYVAITGVASPSSENYPVRHPTGTTFVSVYYKDELHSFQKCFDGGRNEIRTSSVIFILEEILKLIETV